MVFQLSSHAFDHVPDQLAQVGLPVFDGELAGLNARDIEQLADQSCELVGLELDGHGRAPCSFRIGDVVFLELSAKQLRVTTQTGHRRLQLVGRD